MAKEWVFATYPNPYKVATSQGYFPMWQLPKCAISQAATSQVCPRRSARPPLQPVAPQRAKPNLLEVAAWEIAHLGSCHLGNWYLGSLPWENAFGKVPNTNIRTLIVKEQKSLISIMNSSNKNIENISETWKSDYALILLRILSIPIFSPVRIL